VPPVHRALLLQKPTSHPQIVKAILGFLIIWIVKQF